MNLAHLKTFLWLRWRLRVNQFKRGGALNAVIMAIVAWAAVVLSGILLFVGFFVGLLALPQAPPWVKLVVWDGIVLAMLFSWMIGLMTDLQRSDGLALDKFLHLPVSPVGAFLINYLSSLFSLTLIVFLPGMTGLILGQVFGEGPAMLLALPLLAAFVLALTAVTYQFQGWLASLMSNPRKRRTVIVLVTLSFILTAQLPNLVNILIPRRIKEDAASYTKQTEERSALQKEFIAKQITAAEFQRRQLELADEQKARREAQSRESSEQLERTARLVNTVLPPGWFALGAADLTAGSVLPALLGGAGLTLIGAFSLRRAYRTTLRLYTGTAGGGGSKPAGPAAAPTDPTKLRLLEWRLPWVPEQASAVATAAFRSLVRAPESKMAMIVPVILLVVFGVISATVDTMPPEAARPLIPFGATAMVLLISIQLAGNQFGYDRSGFRAYVLSPAPRRDILLGKNLALAPVPLGLSWLVTLVAAALFPMRVDLVLAAALQSVSMYLLFCLLANLVSVLTPMPMAAGAIQPTGVKLVPVLVQMLLMMFYPVVLLPTLLPLGVEVLLAELDVVRGVPIALPLTVLVLAGIVAVYRYALTWEGRLLAAREQTVLGIVTSKVE